MIGKDVYLCYFEKTKSIGKVSEINHVRDSDLYIARIEGGTVAFNVEVLTDVNGNPFYPERGGMKNVSEIA